MSWPQAVAVVGVAWAFAWMVREVFRISEDEASFRAWEEREERQRRLGAADVGRETSGTVQ